jgi:hypothetical protein
MSLTHINSAVDNEFAEICSIDGAFGRWIIGLWGWFPELTFEDQKEAFLILLKRLLDEGKVFLFVPHMMTYNKIETPVRSYREYDGIWDISHEAMIDYIRNNWPNDVTDENDEKLISFWYDGVCPWIGWIDPETGNVVAS